jgi:glycosyltransferase involved in cell wall biosynthesis
VVHLTSSTFFGGPERQMLGLAEKMREHVETALVSFAEKGRSTPFLEAVRSRGFHAFRPRADFPRVRAAVGETASFLRELTCGALICHGYKAAILGRLAARRIGIPAIAVSRGWTGESRRVRFYEWVDRRNLRLMDHVVCVSHGQAEKVRRWCRVPESRLSVIHNSARLAAFETRDPTARHRLLAYFPKGTEQVVLAAGRLSPEKGFIVLLEAASAICNQNPSAGIAIFGEGAQRGELERRVSEFGLAKRVVLPGFRGDLDTLIGAADIVVLPSFTEGLPNVALEAGAAGVPVVATAVGGPPEVVSDGVTGFLVPPASSEAIAARVTELLHDPGLAACMGSAARERMKKEFTFEAQADAYFRLLNTLCLTPLKNAA